jgi:hypothetical protein
MNAFAQNCAPLGERSAIESGLIEAEKLPRATTAMC